MEELIIKGFVNSLTWYNLGAMIIGTVLGIIFGALPGLSATTGMALLLPLTFGLPIDSGLLMLAGVYCGAVYGGSISAVLVGIPGTAAALPTTFDGFPMARNGRAIEALLFALYSSSFGGLISALVLMFLTPFIANWVLKFGAPEIFALTLWGMSVVSSIVGKDITKGVIASLIGLLVSTVGADPVNGHNRFTFGNYYLINGFDFVPLVLGALAIPRVFEMIENIREEKVFYKPEATRRWFLRPLEFFRHWVILIKSSIIGVLVGIAPAAGPTIAAFMGYNEAKRSSKHPELFGTGIPEGIVACETANNAAVGGSLVLALSVGIPGSAAAAVLVGALIMKGFHPGPMLMQNNALTVYTFFAGFLLVNILFLIIGHFFIQVGYSIIQMPLKVLAPVVLMICTLGAYSSSGNMFNIYVMIVSGVIAYFLVKLDFPVPPFLLSLILGPLMEANLWVTHLITFGNYWVLLKRPLFMGIMLLTVITFMTPVIINLRSKKATAAIESQ